jgi:hypothetical protein
MRTLTTPGSSLMILPYSQIMNAMRAGGYHEGQLRKTYTHLMAPFMMAFKPAPLTNIILYRGRPRFRAVAARQRSSSMPGPAATDNS